MNDIQIFLMKRSVDMGYPDPGHDEYFLVRSEPRRYSLLQRFFGNKNIDLLCYGENKPNDIELKNDISRHMTDLSFCINTLQVVR